ncbi:leukocyte immunoglobulin-like receptor subfamily A member 3 [Scleropages formosus]|uniref:leukocyte immunoglobulin-like receptor subfamily A member 3 n=1 Tax=Scleropages formosus TaxID=113540 RepID=UPI0010FAB52B|nr:leukocyte immunoglobulin-like receptor subfamily A member 3 [Scleropages formosus]
MLNAAICPGLSEDTPETPKAVLTLQSAWTQIFTGETVTFRCEVQDGLTDWTYWWYKDGRVIPVYYSNTLTYSPVEVSHSGRYTCAGERNRNSNTLRSNTSSAVTLTVSDKPRPLLSVTPQGTIYEGESVTLTCRVPGPSTGWRYQWYKLVRYNTGLGYVLYNGRYDSPELLPDSVGGATGSYTLRPAALTNTGTYVCGAVRGTPGYDTQYSDVHSLEVKGELLSFTGIRVSSGCCV